MKTREFSPGISDEGVADMDRAIELIVSGKKDPAFERRIREQAERIAEEIFAKHGLVDIGVPAIRELRGELPA